MNVVDSSGWLEYFSDGPNADVFAMPLEAVSELIVPTISLFEVFKRILVQRGEEAALQAAGLMHQGTVVAFSASTALHAARLGVELKLPMADSMILATAREHSATLWTQDSDFDGIAGVRYFPKAG